MAKTWTIVIFTDENTVEVVPTNWIQNNKCYWPSLTSDKMISTIKNHDAPNDSWPSYPIRLVRNGTFANYSIAQEKCRKAEYSSDINSDRSLENKKRVMTKKTYGSSFEEDSLLSSDDNNNLPTKLPTPPRLTNDTSTSIKTKPKKKSEATNSLDKLRNEKQMNLSQSIEKYFKEIIRQQNILKASMWQYTDSLQELTTSINRILTNNKVTHQVEEEASFFTMFDFPLKNEEDLIRVDEYLNEEKNFNVAMNELSKIGGNSIYNFTQRALNMLITNDLAATYSWLGRRAKKTFNKLKLADLIIGSVKRSILNSTNKECEEAIQKWLRRAKERSNNNKKRGENNIDDMEQNNL
ncbi:hypothetical protein CAJAP_05114 [Camponotus japonicus]